jgi:transcriptional regulator with XRE-family HTH domain
MLNIELVDRLYAQLPREQQQQLIARLFKQSKQTMAYFRRTKDISLSKLETLADFFNIPLDALRQGSTTPPLHAERDNKFLMENEQLRKEIEHLKALLRSKDETIEAKNENISMLKSQLLLRQQESA